ncbi:hypothetical protein CDL15_Pgr000625 [Punica granatum]|uniref:CCHC-type domain-containing protein n=1 Tax=Punica granatum TaxID=22663 RepID=A0A218W3P4_PUNGR|nr:hypothetical protein CDL15_Pgr000625 [Punica granatum]
MELQLTPYERFRKYGPSNFSGSADPIEAENWITGMERIFSIMEVSDTQRVALASFMLEGDAQYWWEATQRRLDPNSLHAITWFEFTQAFYNKYFPASFRRTKEREFLNLKQGELGVAEYELKFTKLSRFAPTLVSDETSKCNRFLDGLNLNIRSRLSVLDISTFSDLYNKAIIAEEDLREEVAQREQCSDQPSSSGLAKSYRPPKTGEFTQSFFKSKTPSQRGPLSSYHPGGAFSWTEQKRGRADITRSQNCQGCGRVHSGVCRVQSGECYYCGQLGHLRNNCPELQSRVATCFRCGMRGHMARNCTQHFPSTISSSSVGNRPSQMRGRGQGSSNKSLQSRGGGSMGSSAGLANRPMTQGRMFTLTKRDAEATPTVVTGTLNLFNRPAHILINPGSAHSYISLSFVMHSDRPRESFDSSMSIATPTGESVIVDEVYRGCMLQLGDREMLVDLIPLSIQDFDVILGVRTRISSRRGTHARA